MHGRKPDLTLVEAEFRPTDIPSSPPGLSAVARAEWKKVASILHRRGLLGDDCLGILECYCRAFSDMRHFAAILDAEGAFEGKRRHPAHAAYVTAADRVVKYGGELGLSPRKRSIRQRAVPGGDWADGLLA
jgi:P27 family predicted phage terminase small subunit